MKTILLTCALGLVYDPFTVKITDDTITYKDLAPMPYTTEGTLLRAEALDQRPQLGGRYTARRERIELDRATGKIDYVVSYRYKELPRRLETRGRTAEPWWWQTLSGESATCKRQESLF